MSGNPGHRRLRQEHWSLRRAWTTQRLVRETEVGCEERRKEIVPERGRAFSQTVSPQMHEVQ